jgi:hypothetical protein
MKRALTVVAALLLGLVGLLMSLCGGGFFLSFGRQDPMMSVLTIGSILIGLAVLWGAARLLLKARRKEPSDLDSQ